MRTVVSQVRTGPGPTDAGGDRVRRALEAVSAGRPVVVTDDEDRENEGDLIFAAELSSPELMAFTVRHTSGYVCVALHGSECERHRDSRVVGALRAVPAEHLPGADRRTGVAAVPDVAEAGAPHPRRARPSP